MLRMNSKDKDARVNDNISSNILSNIPRSLNRYDSSNVERKKHVLHSHERASQYWPKDQN